MQPGALKATVHRWMAPVVEPVRALHAVPGYARYLTAWARYSSLPGAEPLMLEDSFPCLHDATHTTTFDAHYFYQRLASP